MLNRSIALIAAIAMLSSASSAMAGLLSMPINLKYAIESSNDLARTHIEYNRIEQPLAACVVHTDDVLTGPVTAWVC